MSVSEATQYILARIFFFALGWRFVGRLRSVCEKCDCATEGCGWGYQSEKLAGIDMRLSAQFSAFTS